MGQGSRIVVCIWWNVHNLKQLSYVPLGRAFCSRSRALHFKTPWQMAWLYKKVHALHFPGSNYPSQKHIDQWKFCSSYILVQPVFYIEKGSSSQSTHCLIPLWPHCLDWTSSYCQASANASAQSEADCEGRPKFLETGGFSQSLQRFGGLAYCVGWSACLFRMQKKIKLNTQPFESIFDMWHDQLTYLRCFPLLKPFFLCIAAAYASSASCMGILAISLAHIFHVHAHIQYGLCLVWCSCLDIYTHKPQSCGHLRFQPWWLAVRISVRLWNAWRRWNSLRQHNWT